ncbi:virulence factor MviN [Actinomyces sp. zg-332]|uniref:murein biosynthesis integral membrane protein MurJ n=1 Tax=Actinomyces sp. zg-332 TaxID=2708340 RepID=UPI001420C9D6|nr:lipid II flippase MurJ [Actinomyces sp. zg-332]QPK93731.1 virulence factor MviN [Actinomyces sp. zg-332]
MNEKMQISNMDNSKDSADSDALGTCPSSSTSHPQKNKGSSSSNVLESESSLHSTDDVKGSEQLSKQIKGNAVKGLLGAIGIITFLTILSRVIGFLRWIAQASYVGTGSVADAYASANQIPNVLFEVVAGGALAGITIPLLAIPISKKMHGEVNRISSALLCWTLALLVPIALALFFGAEFVNSLLPVSKGSDQEMQSALTVLFLKIFAVQIPFYGIGVIFTGILQSYKKFLWPVLMPILSSFVVITTYYLFGYFTANITNPKDISSVYIYLLGWGTTLGVFMLSMPLIIPIYKLGVRFTLTFKLDSVMVKHAFALGFAGIGALIAQQASVFTTLFLAKSGGEIGTLNIFQYTQAVYVLPYAILAVPIATAVFPYISEYAANNDKHSFANICVGSTNLLVFLSVLGMTGLMVTSRGIEGVFQKLTPVDGMGLSLIYMSPGLVGFALIFHISRCLYAIKSPTKALISTVIGWVSVIVAQIIFVHLFAPYGGDSVNTLLALGIGQSIGMSIAGIMLLINLSKEIEVNILFSVMKNVIKVFPFFAVGTVLALYVSSTIFTGSDVISSLLNAFTSALVLLLVVLPSIFVLGSNFYKPSKWTNK